MNPLISKNKLISSIIWWTDMMKLLWMSKDGMKNILLVKCVRRSRTLGRWNLKSIACELSSRERDAACQPAGDSRRPPPPPDRARYSLPVSRTLPSSSTELSSKLAISSPLGRSLRALFVHISYSRYASMLSTWSKRKAIRYRAVLNTIDVIFAWIGTEYK